ncbi:MAG: hypothetical protein Ct9H300mP14_03040 [Gammaproteobacteria bacterium]|nr:MAG: hypothetical protein Ct9H300mP14_03040 [Gammaproteobacteria bacterium]
MDAMTNHIMIDGNTALLWAVFTLAPRLVAGTRSRRRHRCLMRWEKFCKQLRQNPETGEQNYCIIQAEDELAAIGMALGAAWNGARAFTSTRGPGVR